MVSLRDLGLASFAACVGIPTCNVLIAIGSKGKMSSGKGSFGKFGSAPTRAIIDTCTSENAIGVDTLHELVNAGGFSYEVCLDELPTFRFGNGHRDQAISRADLSGTSLGSMSFYVLGGLAKGTPPLIGARTLRGKNAMLSYSDGCFQYHEPKCHWSTFSSDASTHRPHHH